MIPKEMIEAAARALCKLEGHDPDGPASHFDDGRELLWEGWKADAETALTAGLSSQWRGMEGAKAFIDAVERLAFQMPAPNPWTPQFVQLCVVARNSLPPPPTQK